MNYNHKKLSTKIAIRNITDSLLRFFESRRFYIFILLFFTFESVWIAFSAVYPQAFDENFHFGLIQTYSHYWLPFLQHQPPHANAYGAVARDPSYLYHYLMSFPYRFLALFLHSQTSMVIALRLINVGFFLGGLMLFRRVLMRVGLPKDITNVSLFLFVLIPIVPQLAAQINYDDLLFLMMAWICLQTFNLTDEIKRRKPRIKTILVLAITTILTTLVKYAFMPIALSIVIFLLAMAYRTYRHDLAALWLNLKQDFKKMSKLSLLGLSVGLLIAVGMFVERDGVNLIKYHAVTPDCAKVLSVKQCSAYSAWYVDYVRHQQVLIGSNSANESIVTYTGQWFYWMWYRLFFAVNGEASNFANTPPLPLPSIAAAVLAFAGAIGIIRWRSKLFKNNPYLVFLLLACVIYSLALFAKGYATYHYTATLENMNGRYLVPILLPIAAMAGLAFSFWARSSTVKKALVALLLVVLFLQGGGLLTFILNSDSTWYWPNHTVVKVNNDAQKLAKHVVVKKK